MDRFDRLANRIRSQKKHLVSAFTGYIRRLLFPIYLFPIKLVTYSAYYLVVFVIKLIVAGIALIIEMVVYPFRSLKHFLKSMVFAAVALYMIVSLFVFGDYLTRQYGRWGKFLCSAGVREKLQDSVVRIVGGYSEGTGFFITGNQILTNFHVIADEPSPKIIFPDGSFMTPVQILGNKDADLAVLYIENRREDLVYPLPETISFYEDEPLLATGYPLGTDLAGKATILKGNFVDFRKSKKVPVGYIQTNISLVQGMSGGPLTDQCGAVVGINTLGLAGLSMFITADQVSVLASGFTDQGVTKIQVDPSVSPEEAVKAFYTYLKARRMEDGFGLLSREYLQKTNYEEWTNRFTDILDVNVIKTEKQENTPDTAFVKFKTKNWNDGEVDFHYYEGTWKTIYEDGMYKMLRSNIKEVTDPGFDWYYE